MKTKKVLIVDDDIDYMNELEEILTSTDFSIIKKNNTDNILIFINKIKPDLVILDIKINGMTGIDIAKQMKNNDSAKNMPVIFLTNNLNDYKSHKEIIKLGINIYLKKSTKPEILIKAIKEIIIGKLRRSNKK